MNSWGVIEDTFLLPGRGFVVIFEMTWGHVFKNGQAATLFSPNGVAFTTHIKGGETYNKLLANPPEFGYVSLALSGFDDSFRSYDMRGWLLCAHGE